MRIIKIGLDQSNDIHEGFEKDPSVSRIHCEIFIDDEGNIFLTDKGSTNGTFVNGNKISQPQKLDDFDIVRVGNSVIDWKGFIMNQGKKLNERDHQVSEIATVSVNSNQGLNDKPNKKNILSIYFSYQNEYINGGTYWLRTFLQSLLIIVFGLGVYLIGVTAYKRARSLQCSNGTSIFLSIFISIASLIPFINIISIIIHGYLWFSNGDKMKFNQNLNL